jgi:hypothetical protein
MSAQTFTSRSVRPQLVERKQSGYAATAATPASVHSTRGQPLSIDTEDDDRKVIALSLLKLKIPKKVPDYQSVIKSCLAESRNYTDMDSFEMFRNQVRDFIGDQQMKFRLHAFGKQLVTPTTRAPQFFVSIFPFFTDGPIQGTTDFPVREPEFQVFFDHVFVHEFHVELKLNLVHTNYIGASNSQPNHVLYQGSETTAQSTTLTTAFAEGLCSGRKVWACPTIYSAASVVEKTPSMNLTVPNPYKFSKSSKGWIQTASTTTDFARIWYTSDTALSADTDIIGSVLATFDCTFAIRISG